MSELSFESTGFRVVADSRRLRRKTLALATAMSAGQPPAGDRALNIRSYSQKVADCTYTFDGTRHNARINRAAESLRRAVHQVSPQTFTFSVRVVESIPADQTDPDYFTSPGSIFAWHTDIELRADLEEARLRHRLFPKNPGASIMVLNGETTDVARGRVAIDRANVNVPAFDPNPFHENSKIQTYLNAISYSPGPFVSEDHTILLRGALDFDYIPGGDYDIVKPPEGMLVEMSGDAFHRAPSDLDVGRISLLLN